MKTIFFFHIRVYAINPTFSHEVKYGEKLVFDVSTYSDARCVSQKKTLTCEVAAAFNFNRGNKTICDGQGVLNISS